MNLEKRGKFPGIKLHLTKEECEEVLVLRKEHKTGKIRKLRERAKEGAKGFTTAEVAALSDALCNALDWVLPVVKLIGKAIEEDPTILAERTEAEIVEELKAEKVKCEKKLAQIAAGEEWKTHD